ncbi:MAG: nucleotide exchange factor GrpE [Alphaproteobacteria bacterium]|nr:nucleotide exchange factor GrpE [Alphaproteobacteria bacterium]
MTNPKEEPLQGDDAFDAAAPDIAETTDGELPAAGVDAVRITELEEQIKALKEQGLRYLAEAENVRRRGLKEKEDAGKYAVTGFARDLLDVADNFERALSAMPREGLSDGVKNLVTGIEATGRQLAAALEKAGIKKISPLDQPFDPNFHRVMMEIEDASKPTGTIVQVLQAGYVIHDRLLREALVGISKGGPAAKINQSA